MSEEALADLVAAVRQSPKYRRLSVDLIRRVGADALANRRRHKEAVEATRRKLHQVAGAYWERKTGPSWERWLDVLRMARSDEGPEALRTACASVMAHHASTRERLGILDVFYTTILADLAPIRSVLDLACGLNPLAIPWMRLAPGATYTAIDVYEDLAGFLNEALALLCVDGRAEARDLLGFQAEDSGEGPPDVAFLLKTLPCLEQIDRNAAERLLESVPARCLIVSFPAQSLCGRRKGMPEQYEARFRELIAERDWQVERFVFPTEVAFRVTKAVSHQPSVKTNAPAPLTADG
jgi:16S rRNA (guanine(1405)-N(7))-methyltransferase